MGTKAINLMVISLVLFVSGCASKYPVLDMVKPLPDSMTCRVALLPFYYQGKFDQGRDIFYKAFYDALKNIGGFDIVQEGDLKKVYQQLRLYKGSIPDETHLQIIGNRLDAQLIILGEILRISEVDSGSLVDTHMTAKATLYEASTGNVLWSTYHRRQGEEYRKIMHYGRVNTITGLSRRMATEIVKKWKEEGLNQCVN